MLPTRPPFTACARAPASQPNAKTATHALARSTRPHRCLLIIPPRYGSVANAAVVGRGFQRRLGDPEASPYGRLLRTGAARRRQHAQSDVAEGDLVAVILQEDVPFELRAPAGLVLELALRLRRHERRALELVLDHLHAVQPMLHVHAVDDDAATVDLARGLERLVRRRRDGVVERRGGAVGPDLRVGMPLVVDHLVLVRTRPAPILGDEILHAAVAAGRDLP